MIQATPQEATMYYLTPTKDELEVKRCITPQPAMDTLSDLEGSFKKKKIYFTKFKESGDITLS